MLAAPGANDGQLPNIDEGDGGNNDFVISAAAVTTASTTSDVTLAATRDISIDAAITLTNDLTLTSGRHVTIGAAIDDGAATASLIVNADGNIDVNAAIDLGGPVVMNANIDNTGNQTLNFGGSGSISADGIVLTSERAVSLGSLTLTGGNLFVITSNDAITQNVGTTINADVGTAMAPSFAGFTTGSGAVTLTNTTNDFGSDGASASVRATGSAVQIVDTDDVSVRNVTSTSLTVTSGGNVELGDTNAVAGAINIMADGSISVIDGTTSTTANGAITLTADADTSGAASDNINFVGGSTVTADGALVLNTNNGSITDSGTGTVTLGTDSAFVFDSFNFNNTALVLSTTGAVTQANAVAATGGISISTTGDAVTLTNSGNDFDSIAVDTRNMVGTPAAVSLTDGNGGIILGAINATNLTVTSRDGPIEDTAGSSISVTGTTSLLAQNAGATDEFDVVLDNTGAGAHTLGNGDALDTVTVTGEDIVLRTVEQIVLGTITPTDNSGGTVDGATGNGDLTLAVTTGGLAFDTALTVPGDLTLEAATSITQSVAIGVTGATSLSAGGAITLDEVTNSFGTEISASGNGVTLVGASNMNLGAVVSTGDLSVSALGAGNDITDLGAGAVDGTGQISISGTTSLSAVDDILIDQGQSLHVFGDTITASSDAITLHAGAGLTLDDITATNATGALNDLGTDVGNVTLTGNLSVAGTSDVRISSPNGGTITQTGGSIIADLLRIDSAGGSAVTLTQAGNDINTLENTTATPSSISFTDADALNLAGITAGSLTITAGGTVTDSAATVVSGTTTITAAGQTVTLDVATNDFGSISGTATTFTIVDGVGGIDLAGLTATTATITSTAGDITDSAVNDVETINLFATGFNIALDSANTFGTSTVNASGVNVTITEADNVVLGTVTATGNLTVVSNTGGISDTVGQTISVTGTSSLAAAAGNDIVLDTVTNDFGGAVSASGQNITLVDVDSIVLGDIDATGSLSVTALAGTITDDGAGGAEDADVDVSGLTSLSATGDIILDDIGNDFDDAGAIDPVNLTSGGATVTLVDRTGIDLGAVSVSSGVSTTTVRAGGAISDSGALSIAGVLTLGTEAGTAGTITIDEGTGFFLWRVNLDTDLAGDGGEADVNFVSANAGGLAIGDVDANNVTISAPSGTIGFNVFGIIPGGGVQDIEGTATYSSAGGSIVFNNVANDFSGSVSIDANSDGAGGDAGAVELVDSNALILGAIDAGTLDVTAGGAITDTAAQAITVTGNTTLTATGFDITLDSEDGNGGGLHDFNSDDVFAAGVDTPGGGASPLTFDGATVTIADANRLVLGASTSSGDVTIKSNDVALTGLVNVNGGTGTLTFLNNRDDSVPAVSSFGLGDHGTAGTTTTNLNYRFANTDAENVRATTVVFRADQSGSSVFSNNFDTGGTDNVANFGTLVIDVNEVILAASDGTEMIRGNLEIEVNNFVRQGANFGTTSDGGTVIVEGTTSITAANSVFGLRGVILDSATNDFQDSVNVSDATDALGTRLRDANSIVLGDIDVATNLTVTALAGTITDGAQTVVDGDVDVDGVTSLSASGAITLDDATNDFDADGSGGTDAVNAAGTDITLADTSSIILGDIDATGNMTVTAGGTITDDGDGAAAGTDINVDGTTSLLANGVITLDDRFNDFDAVVSGDVISATGTDISITDEGTITLGDIVANSSLTVRAGSTISQAVGTGVSVSGDTSFTSDSFTTPGEFSDINLSGNNTITGAFSATGEDIRLTEVSGNTVTLGTIRANDDATDDLILRRNDSDSRKGISGPILI